MKKKNFDSVIHIKNSIKSSLIDICKLFIFINIVSTYLQTEKKVIKS